MTKTTDEVLFYLKTRQPLSPFIMFKCCVSGAKEDVEDAKKARAKKDPKQSHPPPSAATSTTAAAAAGDDGGRSVMSNASGVGGVCLSSAPLVGLDRGENVVSGASGAYLFSYYMTYLFVGYLCFGDVPFCGVGSNRSSSMHERLGCNWLVLL